MNFGCFTHGDRGYESFTLLFETNCIMQPESQMPVHRIQPQYIDNPQNICEGVITRVASMVALYTIK